MTTTTYRPSREIQTTIITSPIPEYKPKSFLCERDIKRSGLDLHAKRCSDCRTHLEIPAARTRLAKALEHPSAFGRGVTTVSYGNTHSWKLPDAVEWIKASKGISAYDAQMEYGRLQGMGMRFTPSITVEYAGQATKPSNLKAREKLLNRIGAQR